MLNRHSKGHRVLYENSMYSQPCEERNQLHMKSHKFLIILLFLVVDGTIFFLADGEAQTSIRTDLKASNADLKMSIAAVTVHKTNGIPVFRVTIENVGNKDVMLNLGMMLHNGRVHLPIEIRLIITDSVGETKKLLFSDKKSAVVIGRIDDYVVPLRVGSAYTLRVSLADYLYLFRKTKEFHRLNLKPGVYRVRAEFTGKGAQFVNGDMEGIELMNFWKGTLQSDVTLFRIGEQGKPLCQSD